MAPRDEYSYEIQMIEEVMKDVNNANELGEEIMRIFLLTFDEEDFKFELKECISIAQKILNE